MGSGGSGGQCEEEKPNGTAHTLVIRVDSYSNMNWSCRRLNEIIVKIVCINENEYKRWINHACFLCRESRSKAIDWSMVVCGLNLMV